MAKKKLPTGFTSWIEFYQYIKKLRPELLNEKTIRFMMYQPNGNSPSEAYSVSIACVERQCWRELQQHSLTNNMFELQGMVLGSNMDMELKKKVFDFCNIFK